MSFHSSCLFYITNFFGVSFIFFFHFYLNAMSKEKSLIVVSENNIIERSVSGNFHVYLDLAPPPPKRSHKRAIYQANIHIHLSSLRCVQIGWIRNLTNYCFYKHLISHCAGNVNEPGNCFRIRCCRVDPGGGVWRGAGLIAKEIASRKQVV